MNDIVRSAQQILKVMDMECTWADAIREGNRRLAIPPMDYQNITRAAIASRIWRHEGRKVLAMHPEIVRECAVATSDRIPARNLRALPYLSPMVLFPEPPEFKSWAVNDDGGVLKHQHISGKETAMRLIGFLTFSNTAVRAEDLRGPQQPSQLGRDYRDFQPKVSMYDTFANATHHTHYPDADTFGMLAVLEVMDAAGRYLDWEINTLSVPLHGRDMTLAEVVDDLLSRFHWSQGGTGRPEAQEWMRQLMSTVVGCLFYLCSTGLEAELVPKKYAARIQPGMRKPPDVYKVGWKMGAALTRYRQAQEKLPPEVSQPGREQRPTHRRAHVRRWPNDTEGTKPMIWVHPYWTHREKLGLDATVDGSPNMAHRVPKVGPPGDAEASMRATLEMP